MEHKILKFSVNSPIQKKKTGKFIIKEIENVWDIYSKPIAKLEIKYTILVIILNVHAKIIVIQREKLPD